MSAAPHDDLGGDPSGDPESPRRAAPMFAQLVAAGLLDAEEALAALADTAARQAPQRDAWAMRRRLAIALYRACEQAHKARAAAAWRLRRRLPPLLAIWAPQQAIEEAAAEAARGAFFPHELRERVRTMVRGRLAR